MLMCKKSHIFDTEYGRAGSDLQHMVCRGNCGSVQFQRTFTYHYVSGTGTVSPRPVCPCLTQRRPEEAGSSRVTCVKKVAGGCGHQEVQTKLNWSVGKAMTGGFLQENHLPTGGHLERWRQTLACGRPGRAEWADRTGVAGAPTGVGVGGKLKLEEEVRPDCWGQEQQGDCCAAWGRVPGLLF